MHKQVSGLLILAFMFCSISSLPQASGDEVSEYLQNKDWPAIVLLLKPKQGQNFEQDVILAKALFSLERRNEALKVLESIERPEKLNIEKLVNLFSTQFFNQDTSRLYYDAVNLLGSQKWAESKEKLDQANVKEPGNSLVLQRLLQVELILDQKELFQEHLKLALDLNPYAKEIKVFQARSLTLQKEYQTAYKVFQSIKNLYQENELIYVWYLDALLGLDKNSEISVLQGKLIKNHPQWLYALSWFLNKGSLNDKDRKTFLGMLQKGLKEPEKYRSFLLAEAKHTEFQWVGFYTPETVTADLERSLKKAP